MRIAAFALLAWIILQEAGILRAWFPSQNAGPFNPNTGGVFLALCLPAFLTGWWWAAVPMAAIGILITKSTTAMLAAAAAVMAYVVISNRRTLKLKFHERAYRRPVVAVFAALVIVLTASAWFIKVDSLSGIIKADRWTAWKHATYSMQTEMYGRGLGSWATAFPLLVSGVPELNVAGKTHDGKPATEVFLQAHNEYVQAAFELGVQTLALIIAFLLTTVGKFRAATTETSPRMAAGLAALAVSCCGFFTMHVAPTALLGVAWLGMIEGHFKEA